MYHWHCSCEECPCRCFWPLLLLLHTKKLRFSSLLLCRWQWPGWGRVYSRRCIWYCARRSVVWATETDPDGPDYSLWWPSWGGNSWWGNNWQSEANVWPDIRAHSCGTPSYGTDKLLFFKFPRDWLPFPFYQQLPVWQNLFFSSGWPKYALQRCEFNCGGGRKGTPST